MMICPIDLTKQLVELPSITPKTAGTLDLLESILTPLGFVCKRYPFGEVDNLFAKWGQGAPHLTFMGHVDVVPPGDLTCWRFPPFKPTVAEGKLYGRGTADMKGAIACFIASLSDFLASDPKGSISLLITGDEEGPAINGSQKVIEALIQEGETFDAALVGEPSNPGFIGETIKIGRRGSLNCKVMVQGQQGHVAYPEKAHNPVPDLLDFLVRLKDVEWDKGAPHFQASNLEITSVDVGNPTTNITPGTASARFNIRYNPNHTSGSLITQIEALADDHFTFNWAASGDAFYTEPGRLSDAMLGAVKSVTGKQAELSTNGGTSDGRFMYNHCPIIEFGLQNYCIHHVNEHVDIEDLKTLSQVYGDFLEAYFKN